MKVAFFRRGDGAEADPDALDREVHADEVGPARRAPADPAAGAARPALRGVACMYTTTPDQHFVIARHPGARDGHGRRGFSGHGFKFVPVVGEILADLALEGATPPPDRALHPLALPPLTD